MKKIALLLIAVVLISGSAFCISPSEANNTVGFDVPSLFDLPTIGWLQRDKAGRIEANLGFNFFLGISYKRYFEPLRTNQFNPYWGIGTVAILIPYLGIGADYVWNNGFYLGGGLVWIAPEIHAGYMF